MKKRFFGLFFVQKNSSDFRLSPKNPSKKFFVNFKKRLKLAKFA
jgi:hypothetical protein